MTDPSGRETYEKLIAWLRKAWWGLPDSEHLMPTIKAFFNPERRKP
jgi:hypothetical protein